MTESKESEILEMILDNIGRNYTDEQLDVIGEAFGDFVAILNRYGRPARRAAKASKRKTCKVAA